jgi:hypothetical protein
MSEWISVSAKLPDEKGYFFAVMKDPYSGTGVVYFNGTEFPYHEPGVITHWMPLPSPPTEGR